MNLDLSGYVAEHFHGDRVFTERLDGFPEVDLAYIDLEVLRAKTFGDIGPGDRTK